MAKRIMSLWKRKSKKSGKDYLYGNVDLGVGGSANVVVFQNDKKKGENSPDYTGLLSETFVADDSSDEEEVVEEPSGLPV